MDRLTYTVLRPDAQTTPVIFASPHSGRLYPRQMCTRLNEAQLRSSEDAYVDDMIRSAPAYGAPVLLAKVARAYLDLNRAPDELDPALIEGVAKPKYTNPRVVSGLGVIPRVVGQGRAIYQGKLPLAEAEQRIAQVWHPYHSALTRLMQDTRARFGQAILVDMHSMPRESLRGMTERPDIVLGDLHGRAAAPAIMNHIDAAFGAAGFRTARNAPFAGVYMARSYGQPERGLHCVQVEIDRTLYLGPDENPARGPQLEAFIARIAPVLRGIAAMGRGASDLAAQ